jgi:hypothetical protein
MEARQVDPGLGQSPPREQRECFGCQGGQPGDEVQRLEDDVRGAMPKTPAALAGLASAVRCLELVTNIAIRRERQPLFRDRRTTDVAASARKWSVVLLHPYPVLSAADE